MNNINFSHLPINRKEVSRRNWKELDVILFTGDAYVDHPSFGAAIIGRILESQNLKVAIVPQPNWRDDLRDFKKLGKPKLFFAVTSGNMDSMVNHYTANLRLRSNDAYSIDGKSNFRPDYATTVYSNILKKLYPNIPIVIGGIEASLRRFTHYDFWSNSLKKTILKDSKADLLIYGMAEKPLIELVENLKKNVKFKEIKNLKQTAFLQKKNDFLSKKWEIIKLFSHKECLKNKIKFAKNFVKIEKESNRFSSNKRILQEFDNEILVVNPPNDSLSEKEMDKIYDLPFTRLPHPKYKNKIIPAYEMIKFSVTIHRSCFGGCSFCTISAHQGKQISSRSESSILMEVKNITKMKDFKSYLSDVGGPSANMYKMNAKNLEICKKCESPSCIFPKICKNLNTNHDNLIKLYKKINKIPEIKKAFIGSGIRYDLFFDENQEIKDTKLEYLKQLLKFHVSGRLKVAPEHTDKKVLNCMRKPSFDLFMKFNKIFKIIIKNNNLKLSLIPYFISSHPESTENSMAELSEITKKLNFKLEQVQDFTPTPMTLSSVMFYTKINPYTLKKVFVAKTKKEKLNQKKYFFWHKKNYN